MKTKNDTINAIQTMVDSAVSKAGYDKTRNAMVIARNSNNTYEIEMDSIRYNNVVLYGSGVLQTNEIVKVVIPNNQASQMYILGKGVIEGRKQGSVNGLNSNAFGRDTVASGDCSHAEGVYTIASGYCSHAQGKYNVEDSNGTYADIVGNGTSSSARSNAYALDWDGNGYFAGDIYVHCNDDSTGGTKLAKETDIPDIKIKSYTATITVAANDTGAGTINITGDGDGFYPYSIAGYSLNGTRLVIESISIQTRSNNSGTVGYKLRNVTTSAASSNVLTVEVLWINKSIS